jgi:hypothetical protein
MLAGLLYPKIIVNHLADPWESFKSIYWRDEVYRDVTGRKG